MRPPTTNRSIEMSAFFLRALAKVISFHEDQDGTLRMNINQTQSSRQFGYENVVAQVAADPGLRFTTPPQDSELSVNNICLRATVVNGFMPSCCCLDLDACTPCTIENTVWNAYSNDCCARCNRQ